MKQFNTIIALFIPWIFSLLLAVPCFAFLPGPQKTPERKPFPAAKPIPLKTNCNPKAYSGSKPIPAVQPSPFAEPIPAEKPVITEKPIPVPQPIPVEKPVLVEKPIPVENPIPVVKSTPAVMIEPALGIQFQEFSIHPVWYFTNTKQALGRKEKVDKFRTICNQLGNTENPKIPAKTVMIASCNL